MKRCLRGRKRRRALLPGALVLLSLVVAGGDAGAIPLPPENLVVSNGGDTWRPDNGFNLFWQNPLQPGAPALAAMHYRVRSPSGAVVVGETRIGWPEIAISNLRVPSSPGAYTAEVWLEDAAGAQGAPAAVKLRFDNTRPAGVEPLPKPGWISRTDQPYTLPISQPSGPQPVSGIRGYAISIDRSPIGDPCQQADRCSDTETDLRGGSGDHLLAIGELPEGRSYAHAVAVAGSGMKSAQPGHAVLRVDRTDPVTVLSGAPSGWTNHSVSLLASATDALSGMQDGGEGESPFTAIRVDGGVPATAAGGSVSASVIEAGVHTVSYYARDAAGNINDGGNSNGQPNHAPSTVAVRIDRDPPGVAFLNSQDPAGPETIRARVADSLAGPDTVRGAIAVRPAGSDDRFEALPTEAGEVLRAQWDSDAYPTGGYEFRAIGYDAAGNWSATTDRSDGSRMVLSNPLKVATALHAGFAGGQSEGRRCARKSAAQCRRRSALLEQRSALALPYGRSALFSGRLLASQVPMPGERVLVVERFPASLGLPARVTAVSTGGDGAFAARLAPGPSREVTAVFQGSPTLSRASGDTAQLEVNSGVRLQASASAATVGGRPVIFRGRLRASEDSPSLRERTVQLQFRLPGVPWTEFRSVQTDARGHFQYAYRFSDDDSRGVRFKFRAFVPAQVGWPYRPAGSLPVTVRGR